MTLLLVIVAGVLAYAGGRLHQWMRGAPDRDEAYRDGYDEATRDTFSVAARLVGKESAPDGEELVPDAAGYGGRRRAGRHLVPDELVRAVTYRLTPDRVARAKVVPRPRPDPGCAEEDTPFFAPEVRRS